MRTIKQFIDEALERLELDSYNKLSQALGYKSSGYLSQVSSGEKGLREDRVEQWIRVLRIPPEQVNDFREAAALSRATQKADIREDYAGMMARLDALDGRAAALETVLRELVAVVRAERVKLPKELLSRIKATLDR